LNAKYDLGLFLDRINIVMKIERKQKFSQNHRAEARVIAAQSLDFTKNKKISYFL
jgi:hypothetical protein